MAYQQSPGVVTNEIDIAGIVPGAASTEAGFVGRYAWGPVEQVKIIENEAEFVKTFGKPDSNTYVSYFTGANFLAYGINLHNIRARSNSNTAVSNSAATPIRINNETQYESEYYDGSGTVGTWAARYPGELGNSIDVSICPSANAYSATQSLVATVVAGSANVTFSANQSTDNARIIQVGDYLNVNGSGDKIVVAVSGAVVTCNSAFSANDANVSAVSSWKYASEFSGAPGTTAWTSSRGGSGDEMHIIVVDRKGKFTGIANTVLEKYPYVSKASDATNDDGTTNYYRDVIKERSEYVWWMDHHSSASNWGTAALGTTFTTVNQVEYAQLSQGTDAAPSTADLINGYSIFRNDEAYDISLLLTGGHNSTVVAYAIENVAEFRKDCVVFVSPEQADVVNNVGDEATDTIAQRNTYASTSYGFMDSGWKYQFDRYNNVYRWIPLNGDMAGLTAQADFNGNPWDSPAGLIKGRVKNVTKLAWSPSKTDRDELYKKGVNPVVTFPGEGTVLYGDKTMLTKPSAFDRINVRRLFIVLRKSIAKAARYSLFELNDKFTRAQFVALVEPFLRDVKGRRGIYDFKVICDETNNTAQVIDSNRFVADIYIKPARSINFMELNFIAVGTASNFTERA